MLPRFFFSGGSNAQSKRLATNSPSVIFVSKTSKELQCAKHSCWHDSWDASNSSDHCILLTFDKLLVALTRHPEHVQNACSSI